ncbi:MAG: SRPBCC family protein [Myxococcota bacterium]
MKRAISIGAITLAIALGTLAAFGWPGPMILLALAPGLILGSTVAHVAEAWIGRCELRITFVMLGTVLGVFSTMLAVLFIGASTVPSSVEITHERWVPQPPVFVWESVAEPVSWGRWDAWLGRIEPGASETPDIAVYDSTLIMGTTEVQARHRIKERVPQERVIWTIELAPGSALTDIEQRLTLMPERDGTRVAYTISYELPTVTARALHAVLFARGLDMTAQDALTGLEMVLRSRDEI